MSDSCPECRLNDCLDYDCLCSCHTEDDREYDPRETEDQVDE